MPDSYSAAQSSLSFAKLVATPTETAWSQAYNAGNLFACVALSIAEPSEEISLHALGKDLFTVLQAEFFTLEEKNISTIKKAIQTSFASLPPEVSRCLTLAFFKDNTLLVFIAGDGKVVMKRDEKIGVLLEKHNAPLDAMTSVSGFLQNADTILLETGPFAQGITQETITQALELTLPTDIVEALSPQMHENENGGQAAIVIGFRGGAPQRETQIIEEESETAEHAQAPQEEKHEERTLESLYREETPNQIAFAHENTHEEEEQPQKRSFTLPKLPHFKFAPRLGHRRKLFLNIALILLLLLGVSIFLTIQKKTNDQHKALFDQIYPQAKQDYETGQGLESLNPTLSQENYQKAESLLKDGETKLPKSSDEYKQIDSLLTTVTSALNTGTTGKTTATKAVEPDKNSLLQVEQTNKDGLAFGEDTNDIYMITPKAISTVSKSSGTKKDIIKNTDYWSSPQAIVPYQGNVYILDQKNGVLKFVAGSGGFGKSAYFSSNAPDLSQATGMAIDGSVWLVLKGGALMQYTKGVSNGLKVTGLQQPLNNPTKLVTDITMEHVYILDAGNNRIVQFDKHGAYQNAYTSPVVGQATDFTVSEKDKHILIFSGGKVLQMDL